MNDTATLPEIFRELAKTSDVTWSIATFGAIAEFSYEAGEEAHFTSNDSGFNILTPRGALLYNHSPNVKIVAYEGLSKHPALWSQGISICLPENDARRSARSVLSEADLDTGALQDSHRQEHLFDIGVNAPHVDAFVRTGDEELVSILRSNAGKPLFGENADALHAILERSPDRVFVSALGRIEVRTPIAPEGGETEIGPHTHVLSDLLAAGRTHAANVPIPTGYLPCMNIFPPNPARDSRGDARDFDQGDHDFFQGLISAYGDREANAIKERVRSAVNDGDGPDILEEDCKSLSRTERTALRVALRQLRFTNGDSPALDQWLSVYEPNDSHA